MTKTIEERMLSIEQQLSEIRKEMEEELARYKKPQMGGTSNCYTFSQDTLYKFQTGGAGVTKCLWEGAGAVSSCSKCTCAKCSNYR